MKRKSKRAQQKGGTIAAAAARAIRAGKGTEGVIAAVKAAFPRARTSPACVAWYRAEMRRNGERVPAAKKMKGGRKEARHAAR